MIWNQRTVLVRCLGLLLEAGPRERELSISLGEGLLVQKIGHSIHSFIHSTNLRDFPGGPVVKTPCFHCKGHRFDPWSWN